MKIAHRMLAIMMIMLTASVFSYATGVLTIPIDVSASGKCRRSEQDGECRHRRQCPQPFWICLMWFHM